jgi:histidine 2-aminobutanoyltransferase
MTTLAPSLLLHELDYLRLQLQDGVKRQDFADLNRVIERVCSVLSDDAHCAGYAHAADSASERIVGEIQEVANRAACMLEKQTARELVANRLARSRYFEQVSEFCIREAQQVQLNSASRVLFVGAGAVPVSAIALKRTFGCQVTCLDCDLEASTLARQVTDVLDLDLEVVWGRAERTPVGPYTHVWLASLVAGKEALLQRMATRMSRSARVLVRYAHGLRRIFNYGFSLQECPAYEQLALLVQPGHLHDTAVLARR